MRLLYTIFLCLFVFNINTSFGQYKNIHKGAYLNIHEFINNSPSLNLNFKIIRKNKLYSVNKTDFYNVIKSNTYHIKSLDHLIRRKTIKKKIWLIYDGNDLYINWYKYYKGKGYAKILEMGPYAYFIGHPIKKPTIRQFYNEESEVMGSESSFSYINYHNIANYAYILNLENGVVHNLTSSYLDWILEATPEIKNQYDNEIDKANLEIQLKYLRLLNNRLYPK